MDRLWSPWRARHIERMTQDKDYEQQTASIFSKMAQEDHDEANLILWRGAEVFVLMNLYPYTNGHLMIVPYREVANYEDLTETEQTALALTTGSCIKWLKKALQPDGFNVGLNLGSAAGAGIPTHLHLHIVPRWHGDTNFMPTLGEVKVIPEDLRVTYQKLRTTILADAR